MKKQYEYENIDRPSRADDKEYNTGKAYLRARKDIILNHGSKLTVKEADFLAVGTRGLIKEDIIKTVEVYLRTGTQPKVLDHPTNTCDPYTGNWCEHLMDFEYIRDVFSKEGFIIDIWGGYYSTYESWKKEGFVRFIKNIVCLLKHRLLNIIINVYRKIGLKIAPFFIIYSKKK
jgi:hypothetical protein